MLIVKQTLDKAKKFGQMLLERVVIAYIVLIIAIIGGPVGYYIATKNLLSSCL